jgi:hypothetical protein
MRPSFVKRWLLPLSILTTSALVALGVIVFEPNLANRSSAEVAQQPAGETAGGCSGALSSDYACYQERYQNLVHHSGVEAAFAELEEDYEDNGFVKASCHQLTHVIGRAAADLYGEVSGAFGRGEHFCGTGYYHGVMEAVVARIGADEVLDEVDALCADLGGHQKYSAYHHGCVHGLGHAFMGVYQNELFDALYACDALTGGWEREQCYNGVFMENMPSDDDWSHPSKYIEADQPLYPCTDVEDRYKNQCYQQQTSYALLTQGNDFVKVFELCATAAEDDFRPACYQGLGRNAFGESKSNNVTDVAQAENANMLCMLGEGHEARSNCVVGAVRAFILFHRDARAGAFCESLDAESLRAVCRKAGEEYYKDFALD